MNSLARMSYLKEKDKEIEIAMFGNTLYEIEVNARKHKTCLYLLAINNMFEYPPS